MGGLPAFLHLDSKRQERLRPLVVFLLLECEAIPYTGNSHRFSFCIPTQTKVVTHVDPQSATILGLPWFQLIISSRVSLSDYTPKTPQADHCLRCLIFFVSKFTSTSRFHMSSRRNSFLRLAFKGISWISRAFTYRMRMT